jgi:thiol:disulfide interchange protein DsbA
MMMRQFARTLISASLLAGVAGVAQAAEPFVAGTDYTVLSSPGVVEKPGQIEVREFFWYGCPHCYKLEPHVVNWLKTKPADVNFIRTPAAMNPVWEQNARGFYAVEMMGQTAKVHEPLFNAIQVGRQRLFDQASLGRFYASQGIDLNKFNALYNSFPVMGKISQSRNLAMKYQLDGVPALVVNAKYVVKGEDAKSLQVVNYLISKERALMPRAAAAAVR